MLCRWSRDRPACHLLARRRGRGSDDQAQCLECRLLACRLQSVPPHVFPCLLEVGAGFDQLADCQPAGITAPPPGAPPTMAMPAAPIEARCVRSNSIRARW